MKTCEEYILKELETVKQELKLANKKIEELENLKNDVIEHEKVIDDRKCIYLSDTPKYCYCVNIAGEYYWNQVLKENELTPEFVEEALVDEKKFLKLCDLKHENGYEVIGKVTQVTYDYLLETRCGNLAIKVDDYSGDISTFVLDLENGNYYSNEENAIKYRNDKVRNSVKNYLKYYADKFDKEND